MLTSGAPLEAVPGRSEPLRGLAHPNHYHSLGLCLELLPVVGSCSGRLLRHPVPSLASPSVTPFLRQREALLTLALSLALPLSPSLSLALPLLPSARFSLRALFPSGPSTKDSPCNNV